MSHNPTTISCARGYLCMPKPCHMYSPWLFSHANLGGYRDSSMMVYGLMEMVRNRKTVLCSGNGHLWVWGIRR